MIRYKDISFLYSQKCYFMSLLISLGLHFFIPKIRLLSLICSRGTFIHSFIHSYSLSPPFSAHPPTLDLRHGWLEDTFTQFSRKLRCPWTSSTESKILGEKAARFCSLAEYMGIARNICNTSFLFTLFKFTYFTYRIPLNRSASRTTFAF